MLLLRHGGDDVLVQSDLCVDWDQMKKMSRNELTGSTLASTNPPAIGVEYNFLVTPG